VNHYIFNENDCHLANGTFYYPSQTEEECLRYSFCWTPDSIVTGLLEPLDPTTGKCPKGGENVSLFEWKKPIWIGGKWAFTNWTRRESVHPYVIANTTNFISLQSNVSFASSLSQKTAYQNQVFRKEEIFGRKKQK